MWLKLGRLRVRCTFLFAVFLALLLQGPGRETLLLLLLFAALHECAHALLLLRFGCEGLTLTLLPGGLRLADDAFAGLSHRQTAAAALAGPVCNLLLAAGCAGLYIRLRQPCFLISARLNLLLCCGNLLPLSFLDGGAAFYALLSQYKKNAPRSPRGGDLLCSAALCLLCGGLLYARKRADFLLAFTGYCLSYQLLHSRATGAGAARRPEARRKR